MTLWPGSVNIYPVKAVYNGCPQETRTISKHIKISRVLNIEKTATCISIVLIAFETVCVRCLPIITFFQFLLLLSFSSCPISSALLSLAHPWHKRGHMWWCAGIPGVSPWASSFLHLQGLGQGQAQELNWCRDPWGPEGEPSYWSWRSCHGHLQLGTGGRSLGTRMTALDNYRIRRLSCKELKHKLLDSLDVGVLTAYAPHNQYLGQYTAGLNSYDVSQ